MFKRLLFPELPSSRVSAALLLLRVIAGSAFMIHGWTKIQNPFHWMGADSSMPGILQALAALSEFGGGLAWVIGAVTPLASLGIACTMVVAVHKHAVELGGPFVGKGGYELPLVFLGVAALFMIIGPGRYSVDAYLGRKR